MIKKIFKWIFKKEILESEEKLNKALRDVEIGVKDMKYFQRVTKDDLKKIQDFIEVSVDVHDSDHMRARSWAVVSLQGKKADYIKFLDLDDMDIRGIAQFLRGFERPTIDAHPSLKRPLLMIKDFDV